MRALLIYLSLSAAGAIPAAALEALPRLPPIPENNPQSALKVELGKELFFDPRISKAGRTSCLTCHNVLAGGEDNLPFNITPAGKPTHRSVPTVWNAAYLSTQFWTGGAATLEEQALGPLEEMGLGDAEAVVVKIRGSRGYVRQFGEVFGTSPASSVSEIVTLTRLTQALAAYERTLVTPGSRFDRYIGGETRALSPLAQRGLRLFESVGCASCHNGPVFAGPAVDFGRGVFRKFPLHADNEFVRQYHLDADPGRMRLTGAEQDRNVWRVPQLRGIALTAPYFHNGAVERLDEAVRVMAKTELDRELNDSETQAITAFLQSLTGRFPRQELPRLPVFRASPD